MTGIIAALMFAVVCAVLLGALIDRGRRLRDAALEVAGYDEALQAAEAANAALVDELATLRRAYDRAQTDLRLAETLPQRRSLERELERWADLTTPRTDWDAELRDLNRET